MKLAPPEPFPLGLSKYEILGLLQPTGEHFSVIAFYFFWGGGGMTMVVVMVSGWGCDRGLSSK